MKGLLLVAWLAPAVAWADLPLQARGSATVTGGDVAGAKARALDDAFRQAVDQAVGTLVEPAAKEASADLIKKRILRRARAYVGSYKVVSEGEREGVYAITVDASVADGQLGADLRALGVGAPPAPPDEPAEPRPPVEAARPPLVMLVVSGDGANVWATFGREPNGGPVAAALERELGARGFKLVSASGLEVPVAPVAEAGSSLPLDSAQASALARQAAAGGALVGAARIVDGGRIRGTRRHGAEIDLVVRVDDATGGRLVEERVAAAGSGEDLAAAAATAARQAAQRMGRVIGPRLESHWPEPSARGGGDAVRVHLRGVTRAAEVVAVARLLAGVPGARQVVAQRYAHREVTLAVKGRAAARALAGALAASPPPDTQLTAKATRDEVDVQLSPVAIQPPPITPPQ